MTEKTEGYTRLSLEERELIYQHYVIEKKSKKEVARLLDRSNSCIRNEINRRSDDKLGYLPDKADNLAEQLRLGKKKPKLLSDTDLQDYVVSRLKGEHSEDVLPLSPEQISGRMKLDDPGFYVCPETIYQYVYSREGKKQKLYRHLPKQRKNRRPKYGRKPRNTIPDAVPISQRPDIANKRIRLGDWEGDTIFFKKTIRESITTLVDRKTRYTILIDNSDLYSKTIIAGIENTIIKFGKKYFLTITYDRGSEFTDYKIIVQLGIDVFFANPGSPWQRPTNENTNGRIRRFIPKGKSPTNLNQTKLDLFQTKLNNTPRKCLGFKTPAELFEQLSYP